MGWFKKPKPNKNIDPVTGERRASPLIPDPVRDPTKPLSFMEKVADLARRRNNERDTAIARADPNALVSDVVAPPPTNLLASGNMTSALGAADRQRKRALAGPGAGRVPPKAGPTATLTRKTLSGS